MPNKGNARIYVAYIEELMRDATGKPTLGLRVRIPSRHGYVDSLSKDELPIAYPLLIPGAVVDTTEFENQMREADSVLVIVRDGNLQYPNYIGLTTTTPLEQSTIDINLKGLLKEVSFDESTGEMIIEVL